MPNVARNVGANRIVVGGGIPYPTGDPNLSPPEETRFRQALVQKALELLATPVDGPTVVAADF